MTKPVMSVTAGRLFALSSFALCSLLFSAAASAEQFQLQSSCPASFEQVVDEQGASRCKLVSRYQAYDSLQNKGVGGTQTALPTVRDGFSPEQIDLGRFLFFDPLLSVDHSVACASCHQPDKGFTDGKAVSTGFHGQQGKRSAPSLWNVGFLQRLFWDGRATSLESQALGPLFAPDEMANTPAQLLGDLANSSEYVQLFRQAFPKDPATTPTLAQVSTALSAFQSTLISLNSRYDQYALGYHEALNDTEIKGMNVFRSFVARCAECHTPPLFTNQQLAVIGTPEPEGRAFDLGAGNETDKVKLQGAFKVPSLRNIVKTAPYMHSGRFTELREATEFYTKGRGHAVPKDRQLLIHWHIWEPKLTGEELDQIVAFLGTLTDESLLPQTPTRLPSGLPLPTAAVAIADPMKRPGE